MPHAGRALALSELRERIGRLECRGRSREALPFGVRAVDRHLPGGGLALDALHEVMETGAASEHAAARGEGLGRRTRGSHSGPGPLAGMAVQGLALFDAPSGRSTLAAGISAVRAGVEA